MKRLKIQLLNYWLVLLTLTGCSNDIALQLSGGEAVGLGKIVTRTGESNEPSETDVSEWQWKKGDVVTATASPSLSATYIYGDNAWGEANNPDFTKEKIGVDAITLKFGNNGLISDQSEAANYRKADYLKGTGTINFLTIEGNLGHQYCDLVLTITKGTGWASDDEFVKAMADASCLFVANSAENTTTDVTPYHDGSTFRAILPPANMVKGANQKIATLTFGNSDNTPTLLKGQKATIAYTNEVNDLVNKRFIVIALLNTDCSVSITASVNNWDATNVTDPYPGELGTTN